MGSWKLYIESASLDDTKCFIKETVNSERFIFYTHEDHVAMVLTISS